MDYVQFITIMATMLGGFAYGYKEIKTSIDDVKTELNDFKKEIREDVRLQSARSDQLYTMFIDLLKNRRK